MLNYIQKNLFTGNISLFFFITAGIVCGKVFPDQNPVFKDCSEIYINLLKVIALPLIILSLIVYISDIISHENAQTKLKKIGSNMLLSLCMVSGFTLLVGVMLSPGDGVTENPAIRKLIVDSGDSFFRFGINETIQLEHAQTFVSILKESIPSNIFDSLTHTKLLQIIFFFSIFGFAIGKLSAKDKIDRCEQFRNFLPALGFINDKLLYILPIGTFFLFANIAVELNFTIIYSLAKLLFSYILIIILICMISLLFIAKYSNQSVRFVFKKLEKVIILAILTRTTFACVGKSIECLRSDLKFDKTAALLVSFGAVTCRFGTLSFFVLATVFIANLSGHAITFADYGFIIFTSIFASIASAGVGGIGSLQLMTIILNPLGLQLNNVLPLLIAVDPLTDTFDTLGNVIGNCGLAASVSDIEE
jgi:proton glutamate symport protein